MGREKAIYNGVSPRMQTTGGCNSAVPTKKKSIWGNLGSVSRSALAEQYRKSLIKKFPKTSGFIEKAQKVFIGNNNAINKLIKSYGGINIVLKGTSFASQNIPIFKDKKIVQTVNRVFATSTFLYDFYYKCREIFPKQNLCKIDYRVKYVRDVVLDDKEHFPDYPIGQDYDRCHVRSSLMTETDLKKIFELKNLDYDITFYDTVNEEQLNEAPKEEGDYCIKIKDVKGYLWEAPIVITFKIEVTPSNFHLTTLNKIYDLYDGDTEGFECFIMSARVEDMDYKNKVIFYDDGEIELRPRRKSGDFIIDSTIQDGLVRDTRKLLERNLRYGTMIVGPNGTGKTTILSAVEEQLTDYPIIEADATNLSKIKNLRKFTNFIRGIGRCVVLIDEFDSIGLTEKDDKFSELLTMLDGTKNRFGVVYIMVVNKIANIEKSVLRTGRTDRIIEILPSSKRADIDKGLVSSYMKVSGKKDDKFIKTFKTTDKTYSVIKNAKLVQSDYCEIINRISLSGESYNNKNIREMVVQIVRENTMKDTEY